MNEEVWINSDGSGTYHFITDLSGEYEQIMREIENTPDDREASILDVLMDSFEKGDVDTTFSLLTLIAERQGMLDSQIRHLLDSTNNLADNILSPEDKIFYRGFLDIIPDLNVRVQVTHEQKKMSQRLIFSFQDVSNIYSPSTIYPIMQKLNEDKQDDRGITVKMNQFMSIFSKIQTSFKLEDNTLLISKKGLSGDSFSKEELEILEMYASNSFFIEGSTIYQLKIHLPRKIEHIEGDGAEQIDDYTVKFYIPLEDFWNSVQVIDVAITFVQ